MPRKKTAKRNVALCYVRQSVTLNTDDRNSPERQKANIQRVCNERGWIPEWYQDTEGHKSGRSTKNRPGWLALEQRISDPDVVALVANDNSRLHRKSWRIGNLIDTLIQNNLVLISASSGKELDLSSPQVKAMTQLGAMFDEWFADDISIRAKDSVRYRKERGVSVGIPPFGTIRDENGLLKPSEDGAWLLPDSTFLTGSGNDEKPHDEAIWRGYYDCAYRVLELYSTNTMGLDRLAYTMRDEGWAFRTRYNEPRNFKGDDVRRIVANWAEYGGYVFQERARERHPFDHDTDSIVLDEERSVFPVDLLYTVGQVRSQRSQRKQPDAQINTLAYPYPLSGIVQCAHCEQLAQEKHDESLRTKLSGKKSSKGNPRYRHQHGVKCGSINRSVLAHILEGEFAKLLDLLTVSEVELELLQSLALQHATGQTAEDRHTIEQKKQAEIAKCNRRIQAAKEVYLDGDITREEYLRRKEANEREIKLWMARTDETDQMALELASCVEIVEKISVMWANGDDEDKQGMARNLFEHIVFDLDTHRITGFQLKDWADRFISLKAALHDSEENKKLSNEDGEGNHVTPTGLEPVSSP